jgi:hypothetical protein
MNKIKNANKALYQHPKILDKKLVSKMSNYSNTKDQGNKGKRLSEEPVSSGAVVDIEKLKQVRRLMQLESRW